MSSCNSRANAGRCISGSAHAHACPVVRYAIDLNAAMGRHPQLYSNKNVGNLLKVYVSRREDVHTLTVREAVTRVIFCDGVFSRDLMHKLYNIIRSSG